MRNTLKLMMVATSVLSFGVLAEDVKESKELQAAMQDIATHSRIVAVDGAGFTVESFREDDDPATIQMVMLTKPEDGAAQVSSDGEVIFLQKGTGDDEMQSLFATAFYLKAKARVAAKGR